MLVGVGDRDVKGGMMVTVLAIVACGTGQGACWWQCC